MREHKCVDGCYQLPHLQEVTVYRDSVTQGQGEGEGHHSQWRRRSYLLLLVTITPFSVEKAIVPTALGNNHTILSGEGDRTYCSW